MTKTTAQIRNMYASGAYTYAGVDLRLAEFDEWLASVKAETIREVARLALDPEKGIPFDHDHDVAIVAAWIDEVAESYNA